MLNCLSGMRGCVVSGTSSMSVMTNDLLPNQSFFFSSRKAITATTTPSSHIQYFSRKPGVAAAGGRGVTTTAGAGSCGAGAAAGVSCFTTGAGVATGSTGAALGGAALTVFFLAFFTTGLDAAGCSATTAAAAVGCSATAVEASAGAAAGAGAATGVDVGAGSATAASCGLVAQAEMASAEQNRATGREILCILDMVFSSATG